MTYREAKTYLNEIAVSGSIMGLDSMRTLLALLGHPEDNLKIIHVAGTNGKGSVTAYLASILKQAGYKTGKYTSPVVFHERELIQINGEYISEDAFAEGIEQIKEAADRMAEKGMNLPTIYEMETALALFYFEKKQCDFVLLETGLGGQEDATNAVRFPQLCVFTSISMDHMEFLGNTLEEIAVQKAGILKPGARAVIGGNDTINNLIEEHCKELNIPFRKPRYSRIKCCRSDWQQQIFSYQDYNNLTIGMPGQHQMENATLAIETILELRTLGYPIDNQHIYEGLAETRWHGRLTCLRQAPLFFIDGGHNAAAAEAIRDFVQPLLSERSLYIIMGVFKDKEYQKMAELTAPLAKKIYTITIPDNSRALPAAELALAVREINPCCEPVSSIDQAVDLSLAEASDQDIILAFGSLSWLKQVGECLESKEI